MPEIARSREASVVLAISGKALLLVVEPDDAHGVRVVILHGPRSAGGARAGPEEFRRRIRRATQSPGLPGGLDAGDIGHLGPAQPGEEDGAGDGPFVRLLDALLLNAMARPSAGAGPGLVPGTAGAGALR